MRERTIVSAVALVTSLSCYFYAKHTDKDTAPYVMVGGFVGVLIGEAIANGLDDNDKNSNGGLQPLN